MAGTRRLRGAASPQAATARDGRRLAAPARTAVAAALAELPARQAEARRQTVPASRPGNRPGAVPVHRLLTAWAGILRGTRGAADRRRARVTAPAVRHARPLATGRGGPARRPRAAIPGTAAGPQRATANPRAASTGAAGPPRAAARPGTAEPRRAASITVAPAPQTTAGFVQPLALRPVAARPVKGRVAGPHRAAGLAGQRRGACAVTRRRVATSAAPGGQTTPGHGGLPQVTHGEARGPRANGRLRVMAAVTVPTATVPMATVTVHHGQPAAGQATAGNETAGHETAGQATAGNETAGHETAGPASGTRRIRARHRPAVMPQPMSLGRMFLIRSAPSSSTRKRGLS